MTQFQDRTLTCKDCGKDFIFTAGEQHFFSTKEFHNEPRRCKACKAKRQGGSPQSKVETTVKCSGCSKDTTVPFRPTQGRPVFCRECFNSRKEIVPQNELGVSLLSAPDSKRPTHRPHLSGRHWPESEQPLS